jgi:dolichol-phosphate mannosyltransferase
MDCDLQHEPARIPDFLAAIERDDADVISGSRYLNGPNPAAVPADRYQINQQLTHLINEVLALNLTDAFCGFKACRTAALAKLLLTEHGYAFPLDFWVQLAAHRLRVREIPVELIYRDPERTFGGHLDDPDVRLAHYRHVFDHALSRAKLVRLSDAQSA